MSTDLLFDNARLQGRVITLEAEVKCLEAVVRAHQRLDCIQVKDLNAENARLKADVERLTERNQFLEQIDSYLQDGINIANEERCIQLEAQVERLTKAGDAMEMTLQADFNGCPYEPTIVREAMIYWRKAKGVKP